MVISSSRSRQRRRAEHAADGRRIDNYVLIGKKQKDRHRHDCDELGGEHNRDRAGKRGRRPQACSNKRNQRCKHCLLYTSDAADEEDSVDLGGRRIIKKKKKTTK